MRRVARIARSPTRALTVRSPNRPALDLAGGRHRPPVLLPRGRLLFLRGQGHGARPRRPRRIEAIPSIYHLSRHRSVFPESAPKARAVPRTTPPRRRARSPRLTLPPVRAPLPATNDAGWHDRPVRPVLPRRRPDGQRLRPHLRRVPDLRLHHQDPHGAKRSLRSARTRDCLDGR